MVLLLRLNYRLTGATLSNLVLGLKIMWRQLAGSQRTHAPNHDQRRTAVQSSASVGNRMPVWAKARGPSSRVP